MTRYDLPPPRRDAGGTIATLAFLVLVAALLSDCSANAQPAPRNLLVPDSFVVMALPPAELECSDRGTLLHLANGHVVFAHWFDAHPVQRWIEYVPASPVCVFADDFEE